MANRPNYHLSKYSLFNRIFFISLLVIFFVLSHSSNISHAVYQHTLNMNATGEFYTSGTSNETFATSTPGYSVSVTWNSTYLYIGYTGTAISDVPGAEDYAVHLYIGGTNGSNEGDSVGNQTPNFAFKAKYYMRWSAGDNTLALKAESSGSWNGVSTNGTTFRSGNYVSIRIPRSEIGSPTILQLNTFMTNENTSSESTFAAFPSTSYTDGYDDTPTFSSYLGFDLQANSAPVRQASLNLSSTSNTDTTATLGFRAASGATSVVVEQSSNNGSTWTTSTLSSAINSTSKTAVVTGLTGLQTYSFRLNVTGGSYAGTSAVIQVTTADPASVNHAPTNINISNLSVAENYNVTQAVATFTSVDQDADETFTYSLVSGAGSTDNTAFQISDADLTFITSPNYESKNSYSIRVRSTDSKSAYYEKNFTILITNENEAPTNISLSANTISETAEASSTIGVLTATDPDQADTFSYALKNGTNDNSYFEIDGTNLTNKQVFDYETKSSFTVEIEVTDAGDLSYSKTFAITVTNENEAPTDISLSASSINENNSLGETIGTLSATDSDLNSTFTYSIEEDAESDIYDHFEISSNSLKAKIALNYETNASYIFTIRVTDQNGLTYDEEFTITVTNVNEAPTNVTISTSTVAENAVSPTSIGQFTVTDEDNGQTFTLTLISGTGSNDNGKFTIDTQTLKATETFDFETKSSYKIRVRATDNLGLYLEKAFTISVTNVNEAPLDIILKTSKVDENKESGFTVTTIATTDTDKTDQFSYTLVAGVGADDNNSFAIEANKLVTAAVFNYETKKEYKVRIQSTDQGGLTIAKAFVIEIKDANDTPTNISISATSVEENQKSATVGAFTTTDEDTPETLKYSLYTDDGCENQIFTISTTNLKLRKAADYETKSTYKVCIQVKDRRGATFRKTFDITITNGTDKPSALSLSTLTIAENSPSGTTIGTLTTTDQDVGNSFTYTFSPNNPKDTDRFEISGSSLRVLGELDFEKKSKYKVNIRTTDNTGLFFEKSFTVEVTDVNEAPTDIKFTVNFVKENLLVDKLVGRLSGVDPDKSDTLSFDLTSGAGDTDNSLFKVEGVKLLVSNTINFETKNTLSIRLRATDIGSLSYTEIITIAVKDLNDTPSNIILSNTSLSNQSPKGKSVGTFSTTDEDTTKQVNIYSLASGDGDTDNKMFTIVGKTLKSKFIANSSEKNSYSIRVRVKNGKGVFYKSFTITIN